MVRCNSPKVLWNRTCTHLQIPIEKKNTRAKIRIENRNTGLVNFKMCTKKALFCTHCTYWNNFDTELVSRIFSGNVRNGTKKAPGCSHRFICSQKIFQCSIQTIKISIFFDRSQRVDIQTCMKGIFGCRIGLKAVGC
jgi:hypothetical protein